MNTPQPKNLPAGVAAMVAMGTTKPKGGNPRLAGPAPRQRQGDPPVGFQPGQSASSSQAPGTTTSTKTKGRKVKKGPPAPGLAPEEKAVRQRPEVVLKPRQSAKRRSSTETEELKRQQAAERWKEAPKKASTDASNTPAADTSRDTN